MQNNGLWIMDYNNNRVIKVKPECIKSGMSYLKDKDILNSITLNEVAEINERLKKCGVE